MNVGFIGLGMMGAPMALNILKRDHRLTVYNRTPEKARALRDAGATVVAAPQDVGAVDVLVTMVSDGPTEEAVILESGLIDRLPKECVHMSSTTVGVDTARKLAAEHGKRGRAYVAAPVAGRAADMAPAGKLFVIAAGSADGLARCAPLFAAIGQRTFEFGPDPVAAVTVKLAMNFLTASAIEAMGEAFALTARYGVPSAAFYEIMTNTSFTVPPYKSYGKLIEQDSYSPPSFAVPLGLKDVKLMIAAAGSERLAMPFAEVMRAHFEQAIAQGYRDQDWAVIARVIANSVGAPKPS